jgi:predicted N-acyltransferase
MNAPTLKIIDNFADIDPSDWDALAGKDPFVSHAYLSALQESGCTSAMPLYLKMNSYGEHVFDFAWADAYHRHGLSYYPKLVCTVPFTPVTGKRLLVVQGADENKLRALLLSSALQFAKESGVSSLHCLFPDEADAQLMQQQVAPGCAVPLAESGLS